MSSRLVLVVEDNEMNQRFVREVLRLSGYRVEVCGDAEAGIAAATTLAPDVVLMDVQLPGRDGLDATRELRQDPATSHLPIVALTALAMPGDRQRALDAGCTHYLAKPIDYRELLALLDGLFPEPT